MAKIRVNINREAMREALKADASTLLRVAQFVQDRVQGTTRAGNSMVTGSKLDPLSPDYKKLRAEYRGPTGQAFGANKSNLTFSGQLLESIKGSANYRMQTISIKATGNRNNGASNAEIAKRVANNGRPFMGLDQRGRIRITKIIEGAIRKSLRRLNRKAAKK